MGKITWREIALVALMLVPLAIMLLALPPIPQDPKYHLLADGRTVFSIPNFLNVASNLGFLIVGAMGLVLCLTRGVQGAKVAWTTFFFGAFIVAAGSAYYHWNPNNDTLVWDRLPMTIAFMALFAALIAEHVRADLEKAALVVALAIGVGSVAWWDYADDLRLYGWVQFAPLVAIIFMLVVYPARYSHRSWLAFGLIFYALSKVTELTDHAIYHATSGAISGHTIKHVLAAVAPLCVYFMLRVRKPVTGIRP